jgi:hypothetical protein
VIVEELDCQQKELVYTDVKAAVYKALSVKEESVESKGAFRPVCESVVAAVVPMVLDRRIPQSWECSKQAQQDLAAKLSKAACSQL